MPRWLLKLLVKAQLHNQLLVSGVVLPNTLFDITVTSSLRQDVRDGPLRGYRCPQSTSGESPRGQIPEIQTFDIGPIPLPVSTVGAWEDNVALNLRVF